MSDAMVGTRPLLHASFKQDGRLIGPWVVGVSVLAMTSAIAYRVLFQDPGSQEEFIATIAANPAFNLIFGQARDLTTIDGFGAWRSQALGGFFAALMAILVVVRNSRANEDSGQAELIASSVVGRGTRLGVAVIMALIASVAIGVLASIGTMSMGGGAAGSITLAVTFTATGWLFTGIAAIASQIGSDARTANSLSIGTLGAFFLVRGYVDTASPDSWAVWLTPLGWVMEVAPGSANNWWPLLPVVLLALLCIAVAMAIQLHRDLDQGLLAQRPGSARGRLVASVWGLALRINRGAIIAWSVAFVFQGLVYGLVFTAMIDIVSTSPGAAQVLAGGAAGPEQMAFTLLMTLVSLEVIIAAVYGVGVASRVYTEEAAYRVEPVLAGSVRRSSFWSSHVLIALAGPALAVLLGAAIIGFVAAPDVDSVDVGSVVQQALISLPALWVLIGVGLATVGARPQIRMVAWMPIVATFGLTILGPSLKLPDWLLAFSPMWHVPTIKAADTNYVGLLVVSLIAITLVGVSYVGFRRRDVL